MKGKQFPSDDEAIDYIHKAGKVKFYGKDGEGFETYIYTLTIGSVIYQISIRHGYLEVFHIRYE